MAALPLHQAPGWLLSGLSLGCQFQGAHLEVYGAESESGATSTVFFCFQASYILVLSHTWP